MTKAATTWYASGGAWKTRGLPTNGGGGTTTPPVVTPPVAAGSYRPVGIAKAGSDGLDNMRAMVGVNFTVAQMQAGSYPKDRLGLLPSDVVLKPWPSASPTAASIQEVAVTLAANELLVLPEAADSYLVDTSHGFVRYQTSGQTYPYGDPSPNAWFDEMVRVPRGIAGMGPDSKIGLSVSSYNHVEQLRASGGVSTKIIGCSRPGYYFGNLIPIGRDLGPGGAPGIGYHFFAGSNSATDGRHERLYGAGAHRGFRNSPAGESGMISTNGSRSITLQCEVDCRDPATGYRVGASPFMTGNGADHQVFDCYFHHAVAGMPVWYRTSGTCDAWRVRSEYNGSGGSGGNATYEDPSNPQGWGLGASQWNIEDGAGLYRWYDCTFICNYQDNYLVSENRPLHPKYQYGSGNVGAHIGGGSKTYDARFEVYRPRVDWGSDGSARAAGNRFDIQAGPGYDGGTNYYADATKWMVQDAVLIPNGKSTVGIKLRQ